MDRQVLMSVLSQALFLLTDRPPMSFTPSFSKPQQTNCLILGFRKIHGLCRQITIANVIMEEM